MAVHQFFKSDESSSGLGAEAYRDRKAFQSQGNPVQVFLAGGVLCGAFFAFQAMTMAFAPLGFSAVMLSSASGHTRRVRKMVEGLGLG